MNKFVIIDGHAILHRAYHALPPLTSPDGIVVNAVYGFFSMFLKILEDVKPQYITVCFDRPKPTFRQELYVGYQQHRPAMAEDLVPQIGIVHTVLEKMNVPIFEIDGYEADDLIGTIAYQTQNIKTIIVSGDRDMLQLVNGHVKVLSPIVGITKMILYDEEKVKEKYGITPKQIIDYKALVGDSSDGYPGVGGIGPKTAMDLLGKYQTFENLYQHIKELPEKIAKKLATDAETAALCKKLATIITDAPIHFEQEKCLVKKINMRDGIEAFEDLGFKSLVKRLQGSTKVEKVKEVDGVGKVKDEQLDLL